MVLNFQDIQLLDKTVFKRVQFKPPLKGVQIMENEACLLYNVRGPAEVYGGANTTSISSEDSVLMKCGNFISNWKIIQPDETCEAITIHFFPEVIKLIFENNVPEYLQHPVNHQKRIFQKIEKNSILKSYIDGLLIYFNNPELFSKDAIKLKLRELIALLYQLDSNGVREILSDLFNPQETTFKKVVHEHLFHDLSLTEFATLLHMSVSTFRRKFKAIYEVSPGQYIITKKLEKASNLLTTSDLSISAICFDCGFSDLSNFSKAFSKMYGLSPSAYQKKYNLD